MSKKKLLNYTEVQSMIQWVTFAFAIIGVIYNGYKQIPQQYPVQQPQQQVQTFVQNPMPVMYWQVAFDPNTGRLYHLHSDGKWYDQPPQIQVPQQVQYNPNPWVR